MLMRTLLERTESMVLASAAVMLLIAFIEIRTRAPVWPFVWLGGEIVLLRVRLDLIRRASRALDAGDRRPFHWYALIGTLWAVMLGIGACACVTSADGVLAAVAAVNVAAITAGISTRAAAFPRLAILQIVVVGLPYAVAAALSPVPYFFILAIEIPVCLAAMSSLALTHHTDSVKLIRAERENRFLAHHDSLTGLPNRKSLHDGLDERCRSFAPDGDGTAGTCAVLCLDLDGFKRINDTFGHPAGDELLRVVAARLIHEVRETDIVARIGGDEFVVLLPDADSAETERIATRIIAATRQPILLTPTTPVTVGMTIGSALAPVDGTTSHILLSRADQALYAAKRLHRGTYATYADAQRESSPDVG